MSVQPIGVFATTTELWPFVVPQVQFLERVRSGGVAMVWLLEIEPFMATTQQLALPMIGGPGAINGVVGLGEVFNASLAAVQDAPVEYHSSMPQGLATLAGDDPPQKQISNRLIDDRLQVRRALPSINERLGGFLAETSGQIDIDGSDGALDYLVTDRVLRDRTVRLKSAFTTRGGDGRLQPPAMSAFGTNFVGRCINATIETADGRLALTVGDGWKRIDRPIQERLYLGTGGLDGGPELAGKPPPLSYGICPNVTPTLVDRIKGIYQVHDGGEVRSIRPRDMAVYLEVTTDVDTLEALLNLTQAGEIDGPDIELGQAATCRKFGLFRVAGGSQITADVEGDGLYDGPVTFDRGVLFDGGVGFDAPGERTFRRYPAGIVYRILHSRAGVKDSELDVDQMVSFDATYPYECGIFIASSERPTVREVCARVADSAAAFVVRNARGQITMAPMQAPAESSQVRLGETHLAQPAERTALPWGAPWPGVKLTFAPNWTPLTKEQISDELSGDDEARLMQTGQVVQATHPAMAPLLPDRELLEVRTVLRSEPDALLVAQRFLDFYAGTWALWRVTVHGIPWRVEVLDTVALALPRFGMDQGRMLRVIALEERPGEYETELTLM